ncbi:MAG: T9SS type A sorting domain-containing protein [Bacteroidales bacterium]|nr:T9SS type A sorting domain-containing protein [Bacteroidales bacterium]
MLGWIYYFEKSKLNWSSRACFDEFDGIQTWDDCWEGLSGMFMRDGNTPQPLYWLCRAYAALNKPGRLVTYQAQPRTVALASKNDANHEMKIIVGRYYSTQMGTQNPPSDVEVKIKNYPYGNNSTQTMVIQKIPAQTVNYSIPLNSPVNVFTGTLTFSADSATIHLNSFADGDAYIVYINPDTNSVLSLKNIFDNSSDNNFFVEVYPNPSNGKIIIKAGTNAELIEIYNLLGKKIFQTSISKPQTKINLDLPNGIYFYKVTDNKQFVSTGKLIVQLH